MTRKSFFTWLRALVVSVAAMVAVPALGQRPVYQAPEIYRLSDMLLWDSAVEVGDLNGDFRADIAVVRTPYSGPNGNTAPARGEIRIYLQNESGGLGTPQIIPFTIDFNTSIATTLIGDTGETDHTLRTLVIGSDGQLRFLTYNPNTDLFTVNQVSVPLCQCDKLASWFDGNFGYYVAAPTMTSGEMLVMSVEPFGYADVSHRVYTGMSGAQVTGIAADRVAPEGFAIISDSLSRITWVPLDPTGIPGAPSDYTGLSPGQTPRAATVGKFFDGRDDLAVAVASGEDGTDASILFMRVQAGQLVPLSSRPSPSPAPRWMVAIELDGQDIHSHDLLLHAPFSIEYYLNAPGSQGLESWRGLVASPNGFGPSGAVGDLDGNGIGDVAYMHGNDLYIAYGVPEVPDDVANDFDGDGHSDLFWQHADARRVIWRRAEVKSQLTVSDGTDPAWAPAAIADLDGNGFDDVLLYRQGYGTLSYWYSGSDAVRVRQPPRIGLAWRIVASGDFDGDGADDLLWRNTTDGKNVIWKRGDYYAQRSITAITDTAWQVVGAGDFDGDGRDDLVWRHAGTGANAIWNGADFRDQTPVTRVTNTAWKVAAVGDFDGDGRDDLAWRNSSNGRNVVWRGASSGNQQAMTGVTDMNWQIATAGDYNRDGRDDLVWRHAGNGANVIWNGADYGGQIRGTHVSDTAWKLY